MKKHFVIVLLAVSANFAFAGNSKDKFKRTGKLIDVIMKDGTLEEFKRHTPPRRTAEITFELPYGQPENPKTMEYSSYIDARRDGGDFYAVVSRGDDGKPKVEYVTKLKVDSLGYIDKN